MITADRKLYNSERVPEQTADFIADIIERAVTQNGHCYCALSGGSSPKPMLSALARKNLAWNKVSFLLVDERWSEEASQQNISMMKEFIAGIDQIDVEIFSLLIEPEFESNLHACEKLAQSLPQQLDLVVLGMGLDGHTASLFPDADEFRDAMNSSHRYVGVTPGEAPHRRISMSFDWISKAQNIVLYIPGKEKRNYFECIVKQSESISPIKELVRQVPEKLTVFSSED